MVDTYLVHIKQNQQFVSSNSITANVLEILPFSHPSRSINKRVRFSH